MSINENELIKYKVLNDTLFYTRYFFKHQYNRKFIISWHLKLICQYIDKVFKGETTRLIINMPPRYGKTELVVKSLMSKGLALNPEAKFIHTSYSEKLALDNSETVRNIVKSEEYQKLFNIKTKQDSDSKSKWYTEQGGGVYSTSSSGQITGFGAGQVDDEGADPDISDWLSDIEIMKGFGGAIVIDDPLKPEDARSETKREQVNQRFDNTIRSRTNSRKTPIVIVMQRLHNHDLTGYLLDIEPEKWEVLSLPAISDDNKALWEQKHSLSELYHLQKINPYVFNTQYQQKTELLKTGGEFFESFDNTIHVCDVGYNPSELIHVSIDSNVLPYIAVSLFQITKTEDKYTAKLIQILPARDPINTARKSGHNVGKYLKSIGYNDLLYIYGDPTTKNRNNIDDNKKSFYQLFCEGLQEHKYSSQNKMNKSNTSVSSMGQFINAIFEGAIPDIEIQISKTCTEAITDYIETKKDIDGGILKKRETDPITKATYEPHGHFSDNLKDFICQAFKTQFNNYKRPFDDMDKRVVGRNYTNRSF